ncbi:MAG: M42 family peptidase [Chloroflexi bacterium]|nr:M42 family peptidase [Chloroflexota bacterium]
MAIRKKPSWQAPRIGVGQINLLENLSNASAISGQEDAVRKIVLSEIKSHGSDYEIDPLGNVLVTVKGRGRSLPKVMLAAHMDEVGFMLVNDEGEGLFSFRAVGGLDARQLAGKAVWVGKDQHPAVIGAKPIHLTTYSERQNTMGMASLRIDLGPSNSKKAQVGDQATFATKFTRLGPSLRGKALDDRLGVATLIELIKNAPANIDLLAAFTVQEEIGLRGAQVAAHRMQPDLAIALDCTPANDLPMWDGSANEQYNTKLDAGPAIYVADRATLSDPRLVAHLQRVGDTYKIPYQIRQPGGGGTDAGSIHKQRGGIPSVSVSVPGRYLHTAASIVRLADWRNHVGLIHAALSHIDKNTLKR